MFPVQLETAQWSRVIGVLKRGAYEEVADIIKAIYEAHLEHQKENPTEQSAVQAEASLSEQEPA